MQKGGGLGRPQLPLTHRCCKPVHGPSCFSRVIHPEAQQIPSPHAALTVAWVFPIHLQSSALLVAPGSFQKGGVQWPQPLWLLCRPSSGLDTRALELLVLNDIHGLLLWRLHCCPWQNPSACSRCRTHSRFFRLSHLQGCVKITGPQEDRLRPRAPSACPSRLSVHPGPGVAAHSCSRSQGLRLGRPSWGDRTSVCPEESTWAMLFLPGPTLIFLL